MEIKGSHARWVVPGKAVKEVGSSREEESMKYIVKMMADGVGGFLFNRYWKEGREVMKKNIFHNRGFAGFYSGSICKGRLRHTRISRKQSFYRSVFKRDELF